MTSPFVVMVAVEALGEAFLTFLVTEAEAADCLAVVREFFCLVGDMVRNNWKRKEYKERSLLLLLASSRLNTLVLIMEINARRTFQFFYKKRKKSWCYSLHCNQHLISTVTKVVSPPILDEGVCYCSL